VDLAMLKNVDVTERARLQFRPRRLNIANHANFLLPNINVGVPAGGTIANTLTGFGQQVQLVTKIVF
jgi:hypothetical protein